MYFYFCTTLIKQLLKDSYVTIRLKRLSLELGLSTYRIVVRHLTSHYAHFVKDYVLRGDRHIKG